MDFDSSQALTSLADHKVVVASTAFEQAVKAVGLFVEDKMPHALVATEYTNGNVEMKITNITDPSKIHPLFDTFSSVADVVHGSVHNRELKVRMALNDFMHAFTPAALRAF